MSRTLLTAALTALLVFPSSGSTAAAADDAVAIDVPSEAETFVSTAFTFRLPKKAAAVDGRLFFDTSAADLVGLAPLGGGEAFMPEGFPGGVAFGAYGLRPHGGKTVMRVVLAPKNAGQIDLKLVIDSVADSAGNPLTLRGTRADGTPTRRGRQSPFRGARRDEPAECPARCRASSVVDSQRPSLARSDVDTVRAGWELARARNSLCDPEVAAYADANGDGCVDIVDVQAVFAAKGRPAAASTLYSSLVAMSEPIDTRFTASLDFSPAGSVGDDECRLERPEFRRRQHRRHARRQRW